MISILPSSLSSFPAGCSLCTGGVNEIFDGVAKLIVGLSVVLEFANVGLKQIKNLFVNKTNYSLLQFQNQYSALKS